MNIIDTNRIPNLIEELQELGRYSLQIGVFGSDNSFMAMLANVHEFGCTIRPKKQYLTIPLKKKYRDRNPRDFDLFFMQTKSGQAYLVRNKGKDQLEFAYMLAREVNIPERSFIRSTFDQKEPDWTKYVQRMLMDLVKGKLTAKELYDQLGARIAKDIQKTMRKLSSPPNSPLTISMKGSNNPLIDSGRLRRSVTWKVVRI